MGALLSPMGALLSPMGALWSRACARLAPILELERYQGVFFVIFLKGKALIGFVVRKLMKLLNWFCGREIKREIYRFYPHSINQGLNGNNVIKYHFKKNIYLVYFNNILIKLAYGYFVFFSSRENLFLLGYFYKFKRILAYSMFSDDWQLNYIFKEL